MIAHGSPQFFFSILCEFEFVTMFLIRREDRNVCAKATGMPLSMHDPCAENATFVRQRRLPPTNSTDIHVEPSDSRHSSAPQNRCRETAYESQRRRAHQSQP